MSERNNVDKIEPYMSIYFQQSDEELKIERETYTFLDALSTTGGLMGILMSILQVLTGSLQHTFFFASLANKMLFTTEEKEIKKNSNIKTSI